jgi:hypothetical protein
MKTNEWMLATRPATEYGGRPRAICADGFSVSIQGGIGIYSQPRCNTESYTAVELGYPSAGDDLIQEYAEEPEKPIDTVYPYVPIEVVDGLLEKHGGINESYSGLHLPAPSGLEGEKDA